MPQRVGNGVGAAARADLGVQIHEMPFNRGHGDAQLAGISLFVDPAATCRKTSTSGV